MLFDVRRQVPRPTSMRKDGIQTRKRKAKTVLQPMNKGLFLSNLPLPPPPALQATAAQTTVSLQSKLGQLK